MCRLSLVSREECWSAISLSSTPAGEFSLVGVSAEFGTLGEMLATSVYPSIHRLIS